MTLNDVWGTVAGGGLSGLIAYGLTIIVRAFFNRRVTEANAAERLSGSATSIIKSVQEYAEGEIKRANSLVDRAYERAQTAEADAQESRRRAIQAERDAAISENLARDAKRSADNALASVNRLVDLIMDPTTTIDRLRDVVGSRRFLN